MNLVRILRKSYCFERAVACALVCLVLFAASPAATLARPHGKAIGHGKRHGNPHGNAGPHGKGVFNAVGNKPKPAGAAIGNKGGNNHQPTPANSQGGNAVGKNVPNTVTKTGPKGHTVTGAGETPFISKPGGKVVVKIAPLLVDIAGGMNIKNTPAGRGAKKVFVLAAGDDFSKAIADLDSVTGTLPVPEVIGAKGPNPVHGGRHDKKGDGNPGGGSGNGHWGEGNKGNGVGNTWVGNQGHGVGEGMAGGAGDKTNPDPGPGSDPDPDPIPEPGPDPDPKPGPKPKPQHKPEPKIHVEAAPIPEVTFVEADEEEFEEGGCPVLMKWLVDELGLAEDIQIHVANVFAYSTDIQPCEATARLRDAAKILADPEGACIAALERVINELAVPSAPLSEEHLAAIAMAFTDHAGDGTYYAVAARWVDALAEYVAVLTDELGYSVDDSIAIARNKYVVPMAEGFDLSVAYVEARLASFAGVGHATSGEIESPKLTPEQASAGRAGAGAVIPGAVAKSVRVFNSYQILGLAAAILVGLAAIVGGLVKSKREK
ncbi:MAG: hypothetical protein ACYSTJ_01495 [Planctomycetota bacterium]|jgi:hypothetical protein